MALYWTPVRDIGVLIKTLYAKTVMKPRVLAVSGSL